MKLNKVMNKKKKKKAKPTPYIVLIWALDSITSHFICVDQLMLCSTKWCPRERLFFKLTTFDFNFNPALSTPATAHCRRKCKNLMAFSSTSNLENVTNPQPLLLLFFPSFSSSSKPI